MSSFCATTSSLDTSTPIPVPTDHFTLPAIKTGDKYLQTRDLILFWLRSLGFSTACSDELLLTDVQNALASQYWEGQLWAALKDGPVCFLFENTGSTFYGKGFEMLQVLKDHFRPSSGDDEGVNYKPNGSVSNYIPLCSRVLTESVPPLASSIGSVRCDSLSVSTTSGDDIVLPSDLISSLLRAVSPTDLNCLIVVDTGATNHMLPDRSAFISYKAVRHLHVRMGNNSYAPVLGRGTAIVSLNGQRLLIRNVLHVPALRVPLYSLWAHFCQLGCGFIGSFDTGMHVYLNGSGSQRGHVHRLPSIL
jgi:hypothetical protein